MLVVANVALHPGVRLVLGQRCEGRLAIDLARIDVLGDRRGVCPRPQTGELGVLVVTPGRRVRLEVLQRLDLDSAAARLGE
eukprot:scaffold46606_cov77-Phaeocystis_antarctica.AAC.5